jgi:NitT/TauT family transport system permease protein
MMAVLLRFVPLVLVVLLWAATTRLGLVSTRLVPDPWTVATAFVALAGSGELPINAAWSLSRAAAGLAAAIVVGIALGLAMATLRPFRLIANPLVQLFYPLPKSALIPVVIVWFGLGSASKIVLIFLGCLLPVVVSTYNGARGIDKALTWSAASLGASRGERLIEVVLPGALPEILSGIRTALAFAFILMVSSEFIIAQGGVGFLISTLGDGGAYAPMFAVILTVAAIGFAADRLYGLLMRRALRWRES